MDKETLSLMYLNNYKDYLKENLNLETQEDFNCFKVKVNVYDKNNEKKHYLKLLQFNKAVLYGCTGSGKSYVLKQLLNDILCTTSKYCIYFDLREYNGEDIFSLIIKLLKYKNISRDKIIELINKNKLCFLFDNYDVLNNDLKIKINKFVFNNEELRNIRFIVTSKEKICDIKFCEEYKLKELSVKKVYHKILRNYCSSYEEFITVKEHLDKYKLRCFLYKPVNLNYLLDIADYIGNLSFLNDLKNECDLYNKYLSCLIKDKNIIKISSYLAYYMLRNLETRINEFKLKDLAAEAARSYCIKEDVDEIISILKETILKKSTLDANLYLFSDENLRINLINEYIINEGIKIKDIIRDDKFYEYIKWRCKVDEKFTYKYLEKLKEKWLKDMLSEVEDRKIDKFYPYIQLFFKDKAYDELMERLNLIYVRFKWEEPVQRLTLEFLRNLQIGSKDIIKIKNNRVLSFICRSEYGNNNYMFLENYKDYDNVGEKMFQNILQINTKML